MINLILAFLFLKLLELSYLSLLYQELYVYKGICKILSVMSNGITRNFGYIGYSETEFIYFKYYLYICGEIFKLKDVLIFFLFEKFI